MKSALCASTTCIKDDKATTTHTYIHTHRHTRTYIYTYTRTCTQNDNLSVSSLSDKNHALLYHCPHSWSGMDPLEMTEK